MARALWPAVYGNLTCRDKIAEFSELRMACSINKRMTGLRGGDIFY